jgi:predicted aspartyl protease
MRKSHSNNSNDSDSLYSLFPFYEPAKKDEPPNGQKYTTEIIVEVRDKNGVMVPIRALLDTGTSTMIILEPFVREGTAHTNTCGAQQWKTLGGRFATTSTARFRFPELDNTKMITWPCLVDDETKPTEASYDMLLGLDLMVEVGIVINTATRMIYWNETSVSLQEGNSRKAITWRAATTRQWNQKFSRMRRADRNVFWMQTTRR